MPIIKSSNGIIEYEMRGKGKNRRDSAVIFLHGWLMSPKIWESSLSALSENTFCLAVWQMGYGQTSAPETTFTMDNWVDWLMELLDSQQIKKAVLVGHSMSGMLSLATAIKYPQAINALVLVDTQDTSWGKEENDQWLAVVEAVAGNWGPELASKIADLLLSQKFTGNNVDWIKKWIDDVAKYDRKGQILLDKAVGDRPDISDKVVNIKVPTLVVHGSVDHAIPVERGRDMAARIPGAEFVLIPGAAHCPPLESPEEFTKSLVEFFESRDLY